MPGIKRKTKKQEEGTLEITPKKQQRYWSRKKKEVAPVSPQKKLYNQMIFLIRRTSEKDVPYIQGILTTDGLWPDDSTMHTFLDSIAFSSSTDSATPIEENSNIPSLVVSSWNIPISAAPLIIDMFGRDPHVFTFPIKAWFEAWKPKESTVRALEKEETSQK